jgi:hypothetical protein
MKKCDKGIAQPRELVRKQKNACTHWILDFDMLYLSSLLLSSFLLLLRYVLPVPYVYVEPTIQFRKSKLGCPSPDVRRRPWLVGLKFKSRLVGLKFNSFLPFLPPTIVGSLTSFASLVGIPTVSI